MVLPSSTAPGSGQAQFSFQYLWDKAVALNKTDPRNPFIYHPLDDQSRLTLTYTACVHFCGTAYATYTTDYMYNVLTLWRLPLIGLLATTTLPALGVSSKIFTITHLIADPIDTLWSLFYKLELAQRESDWASKQNEYFKFTFPVERANSTEVTPRVGFASPEDTADLRKSFRRQDTRFLDQDVKNKVHELRSQGDEDMKQLDLDVIALIVNAYDEWHVGDKAKEVMLDAFNVKWPEAFRNDLRSHCHTAAAYIAADRVSRSLPSVVATFVFLFQVTSAFWRTLKALGDSYDPTVPSSVTLNITPHDIAFGTLYFWLPFAVLATAFVGSANTTNSVVRILERLRDNTKFLREQHAPSRGRPATRSVPDLGLSQTARMDLTPSPARHDSPAPLLSGGASTLLEDEIPEFPELKYDMGQRWSQGGLPTWQPDKFYDWDSAPKFVLGGLLLSFMTVGVPTAAAIFISFSTPTEGMGCRVTTIGAFCLSWIVSHIFDWILCYWLPAKKSKDNSSIKRSKAVYWATLIKDLIFAGGAITVLVLTAVGIFNDCNCWTRWLPDYDERYLSFPQEQFVFDIIKHRMEWWYTFAVAGVLVFELLFFGFVAYIFRGGHRVLKQRDLDVVIDPKKQFWERFRRKQNGKRRQSNNALTPTRSNTESQSIRPIASGSWWHRRSRSFQNLFLRKNTIPAEDVRTADETSAQSTSIQMDPVQSVTPS